MSRQVKVRPSWPAGQMPSKAERRVLGKQAAARRAAARRRKRLLRNVATGAVIVLIIAGVAALMGAFDRGSTPNAQGSPPAEAVSLDPALATKPVVGKGTGELTELKVTTLVQGSGPALVSGQNVTVQYVGVSYATGAEFDASWSRGQPLTFVLGEGKVIEGWDQGLLGVTVGSRVQLDIPANLAYGETTTGGQPAGPLRFVVDVTAAS